jgi:DMSO/TMAO reductase YedYZ molybdopterin-dependent catalytic subunit
MRTVSRREFLGAAARGAVMLGVVPLERVAAANGACPDVFAGGRPVGTVPFAGADRNPPFHTLIGSGLDARLYTDLSSLTPGTLVTPVGRFFIRTGWPDLLEPPGPGTPWKISIGGLVKRPLEISLPDLDPFVEERGPYLMECAGNNDPGHFGLMSAAKWAGAPLMKVLEQAGPLAAATRVKISGFDGHSQPSRRSVPGASWIFTLEQLDAAILATRMNGEPLQRDHGWPVRLLVPGWFGCTCIKWVDEIALTGDDAPATPQMQEFAARTFQDGIPALARDYRPAAMDLAATPVRVEKWLLDGGITYRIVGIMWGGTKPTDRLRIRFRPGDPFEPVEVCPPPVTTLTWTLWAQVWRPASPGRYQIVLQADDPSIRSHRLDVYYYTRQVWIDEV